MKDLEQKIEILKGYITDTPKHIAILAHTNPDGDAIGSSLAWAKVLRSLGHDVQCLVPNKYPGFLSWMPGIRDVIIAKEENERAIGAVDNADIIFFLDFNRIDRLENLSRPLSMMTCRSDSLNSLFFMVSVEFQCKLINLFF